MIHMRGWQSVHTYMNKEIIYENFILLFLSSVFPIFLHFHIKLTTRNDIYLHEYFSVVSSFPVCVEKIACYENISFAILQFYMWPMRWIFSSFKILLNLIFLCPHNEFFSVRNFSLPTKNVFIQQQHPVLMISQGSCACNEPFFWIEIK